MNETTIKVKVMSCGGCEKNINGGLKARPGVEDVRVSLEGASATVRHDPAKVSIDALRAAVEGAGFDSPA